MRICLSFLKLSIVAYMRNIKGHLAEMLAGALRMRENNRRKLALNLSLKYHRNQHVKYRSLTC